MDFGEIPYGTVGEQELVVTNVGTAQLRLSVDVTSPFTASSSSLAVGAGDSVSLVVQYEPTGRDPVAGTLSLAGDDIAVDVTVNGLTDPDFDQDGYDHEGLGGDDCDDSVASTNPDASEVWYDGVDADCAGDDDYDADGDGYSSDEYGGQDCEDAVAVAYPGGDEVWYDGVDGDCDGESDYDVDGDGHDSDDYDGDDCDDDNQRVSPSASEVWYDDVDGDCDGLSDHDADLDGYDAASTIGDDCDDGAASTYPGAVEVDDLEDQDCDNIADEDYVDVGDVVLTEVMRDPTVASISAGQYVEIFNASSRDIALSGWRISSSSGSQIVLADLILGPTDIGLLCADEDISPNGGLNNCDGEWSQAFTFESNEDTASITVGELVVDEVSWDGTWPDVEGSTLSLDPGSWDAEDNDLRARWCNATSTSMTGDLGTPGELNDVCL